MSITTQTESNIEKEKIQPKGKINEVFQKQRKFFNSFKTRELKFRIKQLKTLHHALLTYEERISEAMYTDLKRSRPLTFYSEIGLSLKGISMTINNLKKWARPKKVKATWDIYPMSKCWVQYEPFGQVLIISPWNYPVTLTIGPLTAALAAGNTAILKPSELSSNVSKVLEEMIN